MKERPILMSGEMVRAVLEGRKTQTRRIIKLENGLFISREIRAALDPQNPTEREVMECNSPYGSRHDGLWVRETIDARQPVARYVADGKALECGHTKLKPKIIPSIHMPRWASRINLEITNVRVERLHDISDEDAKAEGTSLVHVPKNMPTRKEKYYFAFTNLWESINGRGSWKKNPWVWVIEFKRLD